MNQDTGVTLSRSWQDVVLTLWATAVSSTFEKNNPPRRQNRFWSPANIKVSGKKGSASLLGQGVALRPCSRDFFESARAGKREKSGQQDQAKRRLFSHLDSSEEISGSGHTRLIPNFSPSRSKMDPTSRRMTYRLGTRTSVMGVAHRRP